MLSNIFQSSTVPVLEQVVNFAQARHGVLTGNIANLDTPGYRTRDISPVEFQKRLKEAVEQNRQPTGPESQSGLEPAANPLQAVKESLNGILRHDDGNVGLEQQIAEISKNQMEHNLAVSLLSSQFRLMQAAVSERA